MKALKDFDYNLWTTEENGIKKYFVGIKATGEVTEVDAEVMKLLRNEEKKMRRHIEEEIELGTPLSLDSAAGDESNSTWLTDSTNLQARLQAWHCTPEDIGHLQSPASPREKCAIARHLNWLTQIRHLN